MCALSKKVPVDHEFVIGGAGNLVRGDCESFGGRALTRSADEAGSRAAPQDTVVQLREIEDMNAKTAIAAATLAASLAGALATAVKAGPAPVQPGADKCYGVVLAGKNDCAAGAGTTCAGTSTVDYDPHHWKYVAKGTCESMKTPSGHGMLTQG